MKHQDSLDAYPFYHPDLPFVTPWTVEGVRPQVPSAVLKAAFELDVGEVRGSD